MKINIFDKKIIFFIFRYKYRRLALNNLLKMNKMSDYYLINLSGPYLYWIGYLIYKINLFKKFKFISCDGWPFLSNEKNSINVWFGGTDLKIPENYKKHQNNYITAGTIFTNNNKIIQFYPFMVKKVREYRNPKIIIALTYKAVEDPFIIRIWNTNKNKILKDLTILELESFWNNIDFETADIKKKQKIYIGIKSLLRIELLKVIAKNFSDKSIIIGNDLKEFFSNSLESNFSYNYLKKIYEGNICLDFLAKDGDQLLYPRSIEILESGGILFQIRTNKSKKLFEKYDEDLTFNTPGEMCEKLKNLIYHNELKIFNDFFIQKFNKNNLNQNTLKNIFE